MHALFPATGQADVTSSWLINIFQYSFMYVSKPCTEIEMRGFQAWMQARGVKFLWWLHFVLLQVFISHQMAHLEQQ